MGRYPWSEVLLFEVLSLIVLYPTRHRVHRVVVLTLMVYLAAQIYRTQEVTDPILLTCCVGSLIAFRFTFVAYLLCAEGTFPDHWRRVCDEINASNPDNLPSNFSLAKKFWWMLDTQYNTRMIGRVQEQRNHLPPQPPHSRWTFFWRTCLKIIFNAFLAELTTSVLAGSSAFDSRVHDPSDGPETYLAAVSLLRRVPYILAFGISTASWFNILHDSLALVCVVLGRSSPTLWPALWGRWSDAYTIRRFWGQTWHQLMRPPFAGLGKLVANKILGFPRGTKRSSFTQLYIAFFLSGVVHCAGDLMYGGWMTYRSLKFFFLQPVAITFEAVVIYFVKRSLPQGGTGLKPGKDESLAGTAVRVVGYCWVVLWFCLTLPVWVDGASAVGFYNTDRGPIAQSVLRTWKQWA